MAGWTQRVRASQQIGFNLFYTHRFLAGAALHSRIRQACAALLLLPILAFGQAQMGMPGSLQVDPQGSASYTVPIQVTPGTAGMVPVIALQYRSGAGNGLVGNSWGIRGLNAITRCGRSIDRDGISAGVHFDATDKFCMDGSVLVAISGAYGAAGTEYRAENEDFTRVISFGGTTANGPAYFQAWKKSGQILFFGNTADSAVEAQGKAVVRLWAVNKILDRAGNYMTMTYTEDNANGDHRPARVDYTGNTTVTPYNSVRFVYEVRTDISPGYTNGSMISNQQRLSKIQTYAGAALVKDYRLAYDYGGTGAASRLLNMTECAADASCLPPTTFTWLASTGTPGYAIPVNWGALSPVPRGILTGDVTGDGRADIVEIFSSATGFGGYNNNFYFFPSTGSSFGTVVNLPNSGTNSLDCSDVCPAALGDVNGDGKADFVLNGNIYWSNGSGFGTTPTATGITGKKIFLADINGDAKSDMVVATSSCDTITGSNCSTTIRAYLSTGTTVSTSPINVVSNLSLDCTRNCAVAVGDINGDGFADIAIRGEVYISNGTTFSAAQTLLSGWQPNWRLELADVDGDSRMDAIVANAGCSMFGSCNAAYSWYRSTGTNFTLAGTLGSASGTSANLRVADFSGDASADLVQPAGGGGLAVSKLNSISPNISTSSQQA